jgi:hypothetical protein
MQLHHNENDFKGTYLPPSVESKHLSIPSVDPFTDENRGVGIADPKCIFMQGNYSICVANSPRRCSMVNKLIKSMYSWRGYHTENTIISSCDPNQLTLEASIGRQVVGTLTIGSDSTEGLLVDALYGEEIMTLRAENRKICELSKLAINPDHGSKELLASLFNLAYIYGRLVEKATDFVIEVNPRHAAYYKRLLGFQQIGETRTCQRVNAPAVLLHLDLDYVDREVSVLAGTREPKQRSLYAYFLTRPEGYRVADTLECYVRGPLN